MSMQWETNQELELAEGYVERTGQHVFLTGKAGTGKTTFLKLCYAELLPTAGRVELLGLTAVSGSDTPTASVRLSVDGEERKAAAVGSGPVDAAMNATEDALSHTANATLEDYHVDAITGGTDAIVTVEIEMSRGDDSVAVSASDSDITRASVRAMVDAMDRLVTDDGEQLVADD